MTAVLWIEEPKTCADCPCMVRKWDGDAFSRRQRRICQVKGEPIHTASSRPGWCPLMLLDVEQPYKTEKEKKS